MMQHSIPGRWHQGGDENLKAHLKVNKLAMMLWL